MGKVLTATRGHDTVYVMNTSTANFIGNDIYNHNCASCNCFRGGAYVEYAQWFIKEYGGDTYDRYVKTYMDWRQGHSSPYSMDELRNLYNSWLEECRKLEKKIKRPLVPKTWEPFDPPFMVQW